MVSQEGSIESWPVISRPRIDIQVFADKRSTAYDITEICRASIQRRMGTYSGKGVFISSADIEMGVTRIPDRRQGVVRYVFALRLTTRPTTKKHVFANLSAPLGSITGTV